MAKLVYQGLGCLGSNTLNAFSERWREILFFHVSLSSCNLLALSYLSVKDYSEYQIETSLALFHWLSILLALHPVVILPYNSSMLLKSELITKHGAV